MQFGNYRVGHLTGRLLEILVIIKQIQYVRLPEVQRPQAAQGQQHRNVIVRQLHRVVVRKRQPCEAASQASSAGGMLARPQS